MIIEFHPIHINMIEVQEAQRDSVAHLKDTMLINAKNAFSYIEDGEIKASIGLNKLWGNYGMVWAIIGDVSNWVRFHKEVSRLLNSHINELKLKRVEMTTSFKQADRWAKMLGFEFVADLPHYGPSGELNKLWVRY